MTDKIKFFIDMNFVTFLKFQTSKWALERQSKVDAYIITVCGNATFYLMNFLGVLWFLPIERFQGFKNQEVIVLLGLSIYMLLCYLLYKRYISSKRYIQLLKRLEKMKKRKRIYIYFIIYHAFTGLHVAALFISIYLKKG